MSAFFDSLRSDLLDRRFLPVLALLVVALAAALAYVLLGTGGSSTSPTPAPSAIASATTGASGAIAISQATTNANAAASETTSGSAHAHTGNPRNPFTPLPSAKATTSSTTPSSPTHTSSTSGGGSSGSEGSTSNAGGAAPAPTPKPSAPVKPRLYIHYHVTAQFGVLPVAAAGTPPQAAQLKTYSDMALNEPLPAKSNPQLVFLGVVLSTGRAAVFGLTGEAILHGSATCKPSATQCQAIELQIGQSEMLEVVEPDGQAVTYELKLVSIAKSVSSASAARAHAASQTGAKVDRNAALALSGLHYSPRRGGLVFVAHPAFGAHAARRR